MSNRITIKQLEQLALFINKATGSPESPYVRVGDKLTDQIGNYHISQCYGGYCLYRMHSEGGSVTTPLSGGHIPARQLYNEMHAYLRGIEMAKDGQ